MNNKRILILVVALCATWYGSYPVFAQGLTAKSNEFSLNLKEGSLPATGHYQK